MVLNINDMCLISGLFLNRAEDHLEESLRNVEELSDKLAELETTIKSLRKQVCLLFFCRKLCLKTK